MDTVDKGRALAVLQICVNLTKEGKFTPILHKYLSYDAIRKAAQSKYGRNNIGDVRKALSILVDDHFLTVQKGYFNKEKLIFWSVPAHVMSIQ